MSNDFSPSGNQWGSPESYGPTAPPIPGAKLLEMAMTPGSGSLKVGVVSDVWTHNFSCLVIVLNEGSGAGTPCLWGEASIGRFGGVADVSPPQPGSAALIMVPPSSGYGYVICSIPSLTGLDPDSALRMAIDSLGVVRSETDDTGANPDATGSTSMSMAAASWKTPSDIFPGDKGTFNDLGMALALLGFRAIMKASELAKIEVFAQDDLVRITSHLFDHWTSRSEEGLREGPEGRSLKYELTGEMGPATRSGRWSGVKLEGVAGDAARQFRVSSSSEEESEEGSGEGSEEEASAPKGVSEQFSDSGGSLINRSVSMTGMVKSPLIQVPMPVPGSFPGDPEFVDAEPDEDGLADFNWGEEGALQMQIRDYLAWVMDRQANAALRPLGGAISLPESPYDSATGIPIPPDSVGYLRGELASAEIETQTDKSKKVKLGDAWVLVMPDGSVSIRCAWGSSISMSHGNITISPSNDLIIRPGRSMVCKPGKDAIIAPREHVDISAARGQARVWGKRGAMLHGEEGGVMVSTHSRSAGTNPASYRGEDFIPAGVVLKSPADMTLHCESLSAQVKSQVLVTGHKEDAPPTVAINSSQTYVNYDSSVIFANPNSDSGFQFSDFSMETDASIVTNKGHVLAGEGQVLCDSILSSSGEVGKRDKSKEKKDPGEKSFWERISEGVLWAKAASGVYSLVRALRLEFSFRTEKSYGPKPKIYEQPWERELNSASEWGEDSLSRGPTSGIRSWAWPGKSGWNGGDVYNTYEEKNVDDIGVPLHWKDMSSTPGEIKTSDLKKMKINP